MEKVLQYVEFLNDGGAETLIKDYSTLIGKNEFQVKVLVRNSFKSSNTLQLENAGIEIISIYKHWNIFTRIWNKLFKKWYLPFKISRIIEKEKPSIVHIHLKCLSIFKACSGVLLDRKLIYTCHSLPSVFLNAESEEFKSAQFLIAKNNLQIIALHKEMANEINNLFGIDNTRVVRNGVDFNRFADVMETKEAIRKELGIHDDSYVIGHVGRFAPTKNHDFIISVFKKVYEQNRKAHLLLVGDGPLMINVIDRISSLNLSENVTILSHRSDIPKLLKAMDVFIFPSKYEGLGISLIEAQVMSLPCVISDTIPKEAIRTRNVVALSLDDDDNTWAKELLNPKSNIEPSGPLSEYNLNEEIKVLKEIYLSN